MNVLSGRDGTVRFVLTMLCDATRPYVRLGRRVHAIPSSGRNVLPWRVDIEEIVDIAHAAAWLQA